MSRMFKSVDNTWNVFVGCRFNCSYCNARKAAETRFRHIPRYQDGFTPKLVEKELTRSFKPGQFIFVAYMGDISFATDEQLFRILLRIRQIPLTNFLLQTKNPARFLRLEDLLPPNVYLGTTIETNRRKGFSDAPPPSFRYLNLWALEHPHKFVSIEPVMDFDLGTLVRWIGEIKPEIVEVGADNYHNNLPEPPWERVEALLEALRKFVPRVIEKDGLERLKEAKRGRQSR